MMILSSITANLQQKMPSKVDFRVLAGWLQPVCPICPVKSCYTLTGKHCFSRHCTLTTNMLNETLTALSSSIKCKQLIKSLGTLKFTEKWCCYSLQQTLTIQFNTANKTITISKCPTIVISNLYQFTSMHPKKSVNRWLLAYTFNKLCDNLTNNDRDISASK